MSKCENCIHYDACEDWANIDNLNKLGFPFECEGDTKPCAFYKDKSLFVELPCKVGDTVYICDFAEVMEAFVSNIKMFYNYLTEEIESVVDLRIIGNFSIHKNFEDFGKTVFLDRAEAEKELERNAKNN